MCNRKPTPCATLLLWPDARIVLHMCSFAASNFSRETFLKEHKQDSIFNEFLVLYLDGRIPSSKTLKACTAYGIEIFTLSQRGSPSNRSVIFQLDFPPFRVTDMRRNDAVVIQAGSQAADF